MDVTLKYGMTTYSEISKMWTVYADISKEDVKKLFEHEQKTPMNENMEKDDSYTCGEVQFLFNEDDNLSLDQILVFPSYEDEYGDISNGDFINMTDYFYDEAETARKRINTDGPVKALFTARAPGHERDDIKAPRYFGKSTIEHLPKTDIKIKRDFYVDPDFRFTIFNNGMVASKIQFNRMYLKREDLEAMKELIDTVLKEMK